MFIHAGKRFQMTLDYITESWGDLSSVSSWVAHRDSGDQPPPPPPPALCQVARNWKGWHFQIKLQWCVKYCKFGWSQNPGGYTRSTMDINLWMLCWTSSCFPLFMEKITSLHTDSFSQSFKNMKCGVHICRGKINIMSTPRKICIRLCCVGFTLCFSVCAACFTGSHTTNSRLLFIGCEDGVVL